MNTPRPDDLGAARRREGESIADRIERISKQRPPAPKGRGIVLGLIGVVAVYALYKAINPPPTPRKPDEQHGPKVPIEAPDGETPAPRTPRAEPETPPAPAAPTLPPGLTEDIAARLRLAVHALAPEQDALLAGQAMRTLPAAARDAPDDTRPAVRAFVLELIAREAAGSRLRAEAFDVALELAPVGAETTVLVEKAVSAVGSGDAAAAPAAIAFLGSLPDRGGPTGVAAIVAAIADAKRPLSLRIAAAHARPAGPLPEALAKVAADETTPEALRQALR